METELRFHLQSQIQDYMEQGLTRTEAEQRAHREFGPLELTKDECREEAPARWLDQLQRDVCYGVRSLGRTPGFTSVALTVLALAIGANTAIFQLLDAVRLRTLPVHNPQQLAGVELADRKGWRGSQATPYPALTNPIWEHFRDTQGAFSGVLAWGNNDFNLAPGGEEHLARGLFVSGDFFSVLGVQPLLGRVFTSRDDQPGCGVPGAVISYAFWERELGGDPTVIGRQLTLNFQKVEIIGVSEAGFAGVEIGRSYDVAVPICSQAALWSEGNWLHEGTVWWLSVMGRLKTGETLEQANAQLRTASPGLFQATLPANYPAINRADYQNFRLAAVPAGRGLSRVRAEYGSPLMFLLASTGLVLLIACASVANLLLARGTAREHEFAVRLAIGASRRQLVSQLMAENLLLAAGGAALGLLLSRTLTGALVRMLATEGNPLFLDLHPNIRMLGYTAAATCLTCILFGLAPALRACRGDARERIQPGSRAITPSRKVFGLRQVLVVSQVALSLILLVSALLFAGSLRNLLGVNAGFEHNGVVIAAIDMSRLHVPSGRRIAFKDDLLARIRSLPGVAAAGEAGIIPLSGGGMDNSVWREGTDPGRRTTSNFSWISAGYLEAVGMRLLAGRDFNNRDTVSSTRLAIVNRSFARMLGFSADPIGKRFYREATPSQPEQRFEITGLVDDTKYYNLREEYRPIAYLCTAQDENPDPFAQVLIRSRRSMADTTSEVRIAVAAVSPAIGVSFRSYEMTVREGLLRERLMATLSGFFGLLATAIAAIGIYGVMSYMVERRTNEIGVRVALGADRRRILALIMRQAGTLVAIGLGLGLAVAPALAAAEQSMLFGLKPYDARILILAGSVIAVAGALSAYLPARRAAGLDPIAALRLD